MRCVLKSEHPWIRRICFSGANAQLSCANVGVHTQVMVRGTFANIRLVNKMCPTSGPKAVHIPSGEILPVSEVAAKYRAEGVPMVVLAGREYGSGSSRDWAAKYDMGFNLLEFMRAHEVTSDLWCLSV